MIQWPAVSSQNLFCAGAARTAYTRVLAAYTYGAPWQLYWGSPYLFSMALPGLPQSGGVGLVCCNQWLTLH